MKPIGPPVLHRLHSSGLKAISSLPSLTSRLPPTPSTDISLSIFNRGGADPKAALSVFLAALARPRGVDYRRCSRGDLVPWIENLQLVSQRDECKSHDPTGERSGSRVSRFGPRCRC